MSEASGARGRHRFGVLLAAVALAATSLVTVMGASPAGAAGPPHHLEFTTQPGGGTAGAAWASQPVVTIQDIADATVNTGAASTAPIYLHITPDTIDAGEEGAALVCPTNPVSAVAGVATFAGCHIDKVGTYTLTAEAPAIGLAVESASFEIDPGTASKLAFVQQPGYGTANLDLTTQPWVAIQDQFGNTVTSDVTTDVTLAIQNNAGPGGMLTCAEALNTVTAPVAGVAKFTGCDISVAGTGYTLGATSSPALTAATSAPFNVSSAGPATGLAFTVQPGSGEPGESLPDFKVAFVDAQGRIVDQAGNITVAIAPSPPAAGVLSPAACTDPVAATDGVALFSGCEISLPGVGYRFRASSGALPTVDSNLFTVGILHLAFITQPGNSITGSSLTPQPIVAVQDVNNQIVDSSEEIELNIAPGTGGPTAVGAVLTCSTNPLDMVAGIAAFALCKIDKPGIGYVITATSLFYGISVNSAPFNVVGPAAKLVFTTQPSDGAAGIPLPGQPVVVIQDAAGQLVTTDNTTVVTLAKASGTPLSGGPGTLTCASRTAVAGVARFANCSISQVGIGYQLTATSSPTLATATSAPFDISALQRIYGPDAIDTSIEISQTGFPVDDSAGAVVLARSDFFSDALAGGPLAATRNAPLLITPGAAQSSSLDSRVLAEINRVLTTGSVVYILGGPLALASGIDAQLTSLGYIPVRVAGPNLFSTAVAIAFQLGTPATIFEATGLDFPDALSAVPAAIKTSGAILLTNGATQAPETAAYLAAHPPTTKYAIGGPLAAWGADPSATPVYGQDLFGTSAAVANLFFPSPTIFSVATGLNYPDALSGGVFIATGFRLGPVLLVSTHVPIPPAIAVYLASLPSATPGYIFGGPLAVGIDVEAAIVALL